jgi:hypothetical protein
MTKQTGVILGIVGNKLIVLDLNIVLDNVVNSTGVDMQAHEVAMHEAWAISASDQVRLRRLNKDPV